MLNVQNIIKLTRIDRLVGFWLLLFPCIFGFFLHSFTLENLPSVILVILGAFFSRTAGCIWNDFVDRKIDRSVQRTKDRPLASKTIPLKYVPLLLILTITPALYILYFLPPIAQIMVIVVSIGTIIYPFLKRLTHFPQIFLGFLFGSGVWIGASLANPQLPFFTWDKLALYIGCIFWIIGYDTIYALQDVSDDRIINIKSTAVRYENSIDQLLTLCYSLTILFWSFALYSNYSYYILAIIPVSLHFYMQIKNLIHQNQSYHDIFTSNIEVGWIFSLSLLALWLTKIL